MNAGRTPALHRPADVAVAILVDVALAAFVLFARSSGPAPVVSWELPGSLAIAVAYGTPAIVGAAALRGRPSLFVAAGLIAVALSATSFSLVTLVLLPPAVLFLAAAGGPRSERAGTIMAILVLPVIAVLLVSGFVALVWVMPIVLAGVAIALLAGAATAARGRVGAARVLGGTVLVIGLAAAAWLLPLTNTTTVCWSSVGTGRVVPAESAGQPAPGHTGGTVTMGPVGPGGSSGCDGGVPTIEASALSLLLSGTCALAALVAIPAMPAVADS